MKAYGMAKRIREDFGIKTAVSELDEDENVIEIRSTLEPHRFRQLQELAETNGWEMSFYHSVRLGLLQLKATKED